MNVQEFAKKIQKGIQKILGEEAQVILKEVRKNNGIVLQGLMILQKGRNVTPTIYLDDFLENYESGEPLGSIVGQVLAVYRNGAPERNVSMEFFRDFDKVSERIVYRLIHAERNRELLEEIPHVPFLDLAVCFYYSYSGPDLGQGSILIYNSHMEMWDTSTLELYRLAKKNTRSVCGLELKSMEEILEDLLTGCGQTPEERPAALETPMLVLSNQRGFYGASCILYPGLLEELAGRLENNLYILPSSIHEVIILPDTGADKPEELRHMVREVNAEEVEPGEVLSDSVYYYDRSQKNLKIIF